MKAAQMIKELEKKVKEYERMHSPVSVGYHVDNTWGCPTITYHCPICEADIEGVAFLSDGKKVSYCWHCGQALSWDKVGDF